MKRTVAFFTPLSQTLAQNEIILRTFALKTFIISKVQPYGEMKKRLCEEIIHRYHIYIKKNKADFFDHFSSIPTANVSLVNAPGPDGPFCT